MLGQIRWQTMLACSTIVVAGCSRHDDRQDAAANVVQPAPPTNGIDQPYIDQALKASAVDFASCRQSPAMEGLAGASEAGEVIVAVDSSGSMASRAGSGSKMDEARLAVSQFVGSFPAGTRVGVLAFGDTGDNRPASKGASCAADPHFLFGPAPLDGQVIGKAVSMLRPAGWTPLASAIRSAAGRFTAPDQMKRTLPTHHTRDPLTPCRSESRLHHRRKQPFFNSLVQL